MKGPLFYRFERSDLLYKNIGFSEIFYKRKLVYDCFLFLIVGGSSLFSGEIVFFTIAYAVRSGREGL